jgi:hypothetical protein
MDAKGGRLFKRRKSVDNDDLKGGGDDEGMQGGRS